MPKRFNIIGQSLVVTDVASNNIILDFPKSKIYYNAVKLERDSIIYIYNVDDEEIRTDEVTKIFSLTDCVNGDNSDAVFTISTFKDFARTNLGFKTASGGSGAGVTILGSDTVANILLKDPSVAGTAWVALDTGLDDAGTSVAIGDVLSSDGTQWTNIGQIVGEKGDTGATGPQGPQGIQGVPGEDGAAILPDTVSQAEAEAGTATDERMWTAERVKQAIDALAGGGAGVDDTPYGVSWDGVTGVAPSKNALYDKIETVIAGVGTGATPETFTAVGGETNWVLTNPIVPSHKMFVNGVKLVEGTDYTQTASTITFTGYTSVAGHKWEYYPDIAVPANYELDTTGNSIIGDAQTAIGDGTTTIDWSLGNAFNFQFGAFNEVFTFTNPSKAGTFILKLVQDSVGSRTATFPATVKWSGGTAPTLTTTATTGTDIITFYFDGTDYFAVEVLNFS